ncbi:MAG TPA: TlpA disulfide reductase family protein [Phycisphaerae bacterium]|nr:TlpA disulfide reductase family protein [Phycisphaerae bacterium]
MHRGLTGLIAISIAASAFAGSPQVGDKAPKVKASKWMTTAPPVLPGEKGADQKVFLVEFWATWCGPCRASIPHLAELHKKQAKDGLVIIGMSNEDADVIDKFMKKPKAPEMPYHVGADDDNATSEAWMADIQGIPHAFLVDKTNTVVWSGHPLDPQLEPTLKDVLAGKFDITKAKKAQADTKKYDELMAQAREAADKEDSDKLFKLIDQMIAVKPAEAMPYLMKRHFLNEFKRGPEVAALDQKIESALHDNDTALRQLVDFQLEQPLDQRNAGMLYRSVTRAMELNKDKDPELLALWARVQVEMGMLDGAIQTMEKAVPLAPEGQRDEYKRVLKYLQDIKELASHAKSS